MPIFLFDVNFAFREKLVPINRRISSSLEPAVEEIALKRVEGSSENGPFWELEAEQSHQAASEDAPSPKIDTSDVKGSKKDAPATTREKQHFDVQRCIADWREAHSLLEARIL
jgi:hypothetical protein